MVVDRLLRWANIKTILDYLTLGAYHVNMTIPKTHDVDSILVLCWPTVCDAGPTLNQIMSMPRVCWNVGHPPICAYTVLQTVKRPGVCSAVSMVLCIVTNP